MLELNIPGRTPLRLDHLVTDYNGTLAVDGYLSSEVKERLTRLAQFVQIHVITADTFGLAASETEGLPVTLQILGAVDLTEAKRDLVRSLGDGAVAALGNGANDRLMLGAAALGICVIGREGTAVPTLMAADVAVQSPEDGLDLLLVPGRLKATLRV